MTALASDIDYHRLNKLLWEYRACFERFEFLLEVQLMVASSARQDWQHQLADLLDEVARAIGGLDLEREVLLGSEVMLSDLAAEAPEPWPEILNEQYAHFAATVARTQRLRKRNEAALQAGMAGIRRLVDTIVEAAGQAQNDIGDSYDGEGKLRHGHGAALLFDGRA
jgi:hypothetical protein